MKIEETINKWTIKILLGLAVLALLGKAANYIEKHNPQDLPRFTYDNVEGLQ